MWGGGGGRGGGGLRKVTRIGLITDRITRAQRLGTFSLQEVSPPKREGGSERGGEGGEGGGGGGGGGRGNGIS